METKEVIIGTSARRLRVLDLRFRCGHGFEMKPASLKSFSLRLRSAVGERTLFMSSHFDTTHSIG